MIAVRQSHSLSDVGLNRRPACRLGTGFLDRAVGIPYLANEFVSEKSALLGAKFNQQRALVTFRDAILSVANVMTITSLDVAFDGATRRMSVRWKVRTTFGDTGGNIT